MVNKTQNPHILSLNVICLNRSSVLPQKGRHKRKKVSFFPVSHIYGQPSLCHMYEMNCMKCYLSVGTFDRLQDVVRLWLYIYVEHSTEK